MTDDSYQFSGIPTGDGDAPPAPDGNAPAYSVSELSQALKRTVEDAYGFVRLRGEISKVTRHASGHVYLTLKDDRAAIDGVIWKGSVGRLQAQPAQGLEVIVTGKITTYPARSSYQIVIETMEPAGVGALLAQLERLKAKLDGEGLFSAARKRAIPAYPAIVGVITSPTGAVIRDILHRIRDRWPCHVIVWPVVVQGDAAAAQVAAAVRGFNAMTGAHRPDVLIVARGGGSIEDLWPFNDEALARTVFEGTIPLVSAVGHETDTTLIDYVSDRRAPTPTGAAEMVTPVLAELRGLTADYEARLIRASGRLVEDARTRLSAAARGLPRPADLLATKAQNFDLLSARLAPALERNAASHERDLIKWTSRLTLDLLQRQNRLRADRVADFGARIGEALKRNAADAERHLSVLTARLIPDALLRQVDQFDERVDAFAVRASRSLHNTLRQDTQRLDRAGRLLETLNPKRPAAPGMARVLAADGSVVMNAADLSSGQAVRLVFKDGDKGAVIDGAPAPAPAPAKPAPKAKPAAPTSQGDLF